MIARGNDACATRGYGSARNCLGASLPRALVVRHDEPEVSGALSDDALFTACAAALVKNSMRPVSLDHRLPGSPPSLRCPRGMLA